MENTSEEGKKTTVYTHTELMFLKHTHDIRGT